MTEYRKVRRRDPLLGPGSASTVTGLRVFLQYLAFIDVLESFRKGFVNAVGIMISRQDSLVTSNKIPKNDNFCTLVSCATG